MAIRPHNCEGGVKELMYAPWLLCKVRKLNLGMPIKATFQLDFYTLLKCTQS